MISVNASQQTIQLLLKESISTIYQRVRVLREYPENGQTPNGFRQTGVHHCLRSLPNNDLIKESGDIDILGVSHDIGGMKSSQSPKPTLESLAALCGWDGGSAAWLKRYV